MIHGRGVLDQVLPIMVREMTTINLARFSGDPQQNSRKFSYVPSKIQAHIWEVGENSKKTFRVTNYKGETTRICQR
jgi:hypothetical protein